MKKALIAMSGGVDSSVAAKIMSERGYQCTGCTMKLFHGTENAQPAESCQTDVQAADDAAQIARRFGMPFYVCDLSDLFDKEVVRPFISNYVRATPSESPLCHHFRDVNKSKWIDKKGFKK